MQIKDLKFGDKFYLSGGSITKDNPGIFIQNTGRDYCTVVWRHSKDYIMDAVGSDVECVLVSNTQPDYRPFTFRDSGMFLGKILSNKWNLRRLVASECTEYGIVTATGLLSWQHLLHDWIFDDDSPAGVKL